MDTPLYVLSTAASMVESVDVSNCHNIEEAALKRPLDVREPTSPTTTTSSMLPQYDDDRQGVARSNDQPFSLEDLSNSKKCAGTQTSFSSFNSSLYGPSEKYLKTDSGSMAWRGHKSSCPAPPPGYYNHHNTMATGQHHYGYQPEAMDTDIDVPLNLTKSSSSHQNNTSSASPPRQMSPPRQSSQLSSRHSPAVSSLTPRHTVIIRNAPSHQLTGGATQSTCNNSRNNQVLNEIDDPEIEEHFRRSLGTKYQSYVNSRWSPQNGETAEPSSGSWKPSNVSITGDVDDHFAKSLGDTWTQIQAQKKSAALTGSVDDHFAKALGDTWFKIKAKTES